MLNDVTISSTRNSQIVDLRKLDQRKHRQRQGRFYVEGLQLLQMALEAGFVPQQVFYCDEMFAGQQAAAILEQARQAGCQAQAVTRNVMESISSRDAPQGLVATFALLDQPLEQVRLGDQRLVVVVDRLQDPGNLGTIIRTADAVGAAAVVLIAPCVDPHDPKTVRATMGSLFNLPIVVAEEVPALFEHLHAAGLVSVGADAHLGQPWGDPHWSAGQRGAALVMGNEARGLSEDVRGYIQAWAYIPMRGQAESLNVAIAAGVLMFSWLRAQGQPAP